MPCFTVPIHEHGDPTRPGPYPHGSRGETPLLETPEHALPLEATNRYLSQLHASSKRAVVDLTRWTESARALNKALWAGRPVPARLRSLYTRLTDAIEQAPPFSRPVTVWRGLATDPEGLTQLQPGAVIALKGFQSTSLDPVMAGNRAIIWGDRAGRFGEPGKPVLLKIETSRGLYVKSVSRVPDEKEVTLGHNWHYEVIGVSNVVVPSGDEEAPNTDPIPMVTLRVKT